MAVEFERLRTQIAAMGNSAEIRREANRDLLKRWHELLTQHRENYDGIDLTLNRIISEKRADLQKFRACRPLFDDEPIDQGYDPTDPPDKATLIAVDGSQAMPTRHAAYLYFLINIGVIVYPHGQHAAPESLSWPTLYFAGDEFETNDEDFMSSAVGIRRDMAEIETLAKQTFAQRFNQAPLVAILDQRLQYWPIGNRSQQSDQHYVNRWITAMETIQQCGGWLTGYIERPETGGVISLLQAMQLGEPDFKPTVLNERAPLPDTVLFRRILEPGQRSAVFEVVNESTNYRPFMEKGQDVCFFYFRPPGGGDISRVDMPLWAAQQREVVAQTHALLADQCRLIGKYPYVLTRADEIAVVQATDREYLDHLVSLEMRRRGIASVETGKQIGKESSRSGKTRHSL